jgi:hypothetical protein
MVQHVEVCLHFESSNKGYHSAHCNKYPQTNGFKNRIYNDSWASSNCHSSEEGLLDHVNTNRTSEQFMEINYMPIRLSIADIIVV